MKVSELSRASGISVATIKFYLREGLLPAGDPTAANQASYGPAHLHRLRLIRTLTHVGNLSVVQTRAALAAIDDPALSTHDILGVAIDALPHALERADASEDGAQARRDADEFVDSLGWQASPGAPARAVLADALLALRQLGREVGPDVFAPYADLADALAAQELATIPADAPRDETVEAAVIGTVVFEAVLVALRRLAHGHHSAQRFATPNGPAASR
ncbi:MAG: MerR family transcriptional regulator [Pseudonocardiales bacterium]|nr:MAG: MerR family transcriptional regulator [Pseudonocardiales bacterium]